MFSWWLLGILDDFVLLQWLSGWFVVWFAVGWVVGFSFDGFCIVGWVVFGLGWGFRWVFFVGRVGLDWGLGGWVFVLVWGVGFVGYF